MGAIPNGFGGGGAPQGEVEGQQSGQGVTPGGPGLGEERWGAAREEAWSLPGCGAGFGVLAANWGESCGRVSPVRASRAVPGLARPLPTSKQASRRGAGAGGPGPGSPSLSSACRASRPRPAGPGLARLGSSGSPLRFGLRLGLRLGLGRTRAPLGGVSASPPPARSTAARRGPSGVCALLIGSRAARSARQPGAASSHWLLAAQRLPLFSHWLGRV